MTKDQAARRLVENRRQSYCTTFQLNNRQNLDVLEDLAAFCDFIAGPPPTTAEAALIAQARRSVFMHIVSNIGLSPTQLYALATGQPVRPPSRLEQQALKEITNVQSDQVDSE